jgi:hypothetical protein
MTSVQIGIALAIAGIAIIITQLFVFERKNRALGSVLVYQIGLWLSILLFLIFPLLSIVKADDTRATFWSIMSIVMSLRYTYYYIYITYIHTRMPTSSEYVVIVSVCT